MEWLKMVDCTLGYIQTIRFLFWATSSCQVPRRSLKSQPNPIFRLVFLQSSPKPTTLPWSPLQTSDESIYEHVLDTNCGSSYRILLNTFWNTSCGSSHLIPRVHGKVNPGCSCSLAYWLFSWWLVMLIKLVVASSFLLETREGNDLTFQKNWQTSSF